MLSQTVRSIKKYKKTKPKFSFWKEDENLNGKRTKAFVIILPTKGCYWDNCSMCGYTNDSFPDIKDEEIYFYFKKAIMNFNNEKIVKIFCSGSFLNDKEISEEVQLKILNEINVERIIIESRAEFITEEKLKELNKNIMIAIGLESSNNFILKNSINKGFTYEEYLEKARLIKKFGLKLKTYILIKPPFLTEKESIDDCIKTAIDVEKFSDEISFNAVNVQKNTLVEYLWKRKEYSPPYLWSVVEILKRSKEKTKARLISSPSGFGNRTAHNCGKCDKEVLNAIREFSLSQDLSVFDGLDCECKEKWKDILELEGFGFDNGLR